MAMKGYIGPVASTSSSITTSLMSKEMENLIRVLQDSSERDDLKFKGLQDVWQTNEGRCNSPSFAASSEGLLKVFIKILNDTQPQFVTENSTHMLRKLILDIILRLATSDVIGQHSKDLAKCLLKVIIVDNEENVCSAIKILIDIGKTPGCKMPHFQNELNAVMTFCRNTLKEMSAHIYNGMFELKDLGAGRGQNTTEERSIVEMYLKNCYYVQQATVFNRSQGSEMVKHTLIPRGSQSVKVIQEFAMLFVTFYQHYKDAIVEDCLNFLTLSIQFASLPIPLEQKESPQFNKNFADEFYTAQSKVLNFITIIGKLPKFMERLQKNADELVTSLFCLLENLPNNLVLIRKDILLIMKFCFQSELRLKFIPYLTRMLCENTMLGTGFTSRDHLRVFMYQILADLLHYIRSHLEFSMLAHVVSVFSRTMNDNTITAQVQIMCVRLLQSVSETLSKPEHQDKQTRDILFTILENLVIKLKLISLYHIPHLFKEFGDKVEIKPYDRRHLFTSDGKAITENKDSDGMDTQCSELPPLTKQGAKLSTPAQILANMWTTAAPTLQINEARNLVKYIMQTCKYCASQLQKTKRSENSPSRMKERDLFEKLFKYGVQCVDVFVLPTQIPYNRQAPQQPANTRCKDEKDTLEAFASLFTSIEPEVYRELFAKYIDFLVERIHCNLQLQMIINTFLVKPDWSCKFGGIMLKYLMDKMPQLSVSNEKTGLYVKLFKLIFSAIGCSQPQSTPEGEMMLKPYLSDLIRKSTEYALTAKEPLNYFLLLRALFRSIGGGAHDILYGQFLPLLPNLLQFLNKLQSCPHRQQMRELFLELCLTVPVRLSSLLPYLPLLMDPLVCALSGSNSLVQQGLRTLELCVDNLQPEYLFEHMAPVRGALMQGLWRVLSTSTDSHSTKIAFRILGKFGGANRRILSEPQQLQYVDEPSSICSSSVLRIEFDRQDPMVNTPMFGELSLSEIMAVAVEQMKSCATQPDHSQGFATILPVQFVNQNSFPHANLVRQHSMELARAILLTGLGPMFTSEDWKHHFIDNLKEQFRKLEECPMDIPVYKCARAQDRQLFIDALIVLFIGVVGKDLRQTYLKFFNAVTRQLTIQGILECSARDVLLSMEPGSLPLCLDGSVLVDALISILSDSNKDYLHAAIVAVSHINETCKTVLPNPDLIVKVPLVQYMLDQISLLCYGPSWYARLGGASALNFMIEQYPLSFMAIKLKKFVKSLTEVIIGLLDEISSGAVDMAFNSLQSLHIRFLAEDSSSLDTVTMRIFVEHYCLLIFHTNTSAREKGWQLLNHLVLQCKTTVDKVLQEYSDLVQSQIETIFDDFPAMSMTHKTAAMDVLQTFVHLAPELSTLHVKDQKSLDFVTKSLFPICQSQIGELMNQNIYKTADNCPAHFLPPYPIAVQLESMKGKALQCLAACYHLFSKQEPINKIEKDSMFDQMLQLFMKHLLDGSETISADVKLAMKKCSEIPLEWLQEYCHNMILKLKSTEIDTEDVVKFGELVQLNRQLLTDDIAVALVNYVSSLESPCDEQRNAPDRRWEDVVSVNTVLQLLVDSQISTFDMAKKIFSFYLCFESNYSTDTDLSWVSGVSNLLSRWPKETVNHLFHQVFFSSYAHASALRKVIKDPASKSLRQELCDNDKFFANSLQHLFLNNQGEWEQPEDQSDLAIMTREETVLQILDNVSSLELDWFTKAHDLVEKLRKIWSSDEFQLRYTVKDSSDEMCLPGQVKVRILMGQKYRVPKLYVSCFLKYLRANRDAFELLFELFFVFDNPYVADFSFFREFLENEIIPVASLSWRKEIFVRIIEKLENTPNDYCKNNTLTKLIQYLLIPSLQWAFERYEVDEVLGVALPDTDNAEEDSSSVVSRLANVLDKNRNNLGDKNVIVFYQLCTLLVEYAPGHIHNNSCKKQGSRLRVFMLFAWPCLTVGNMSDPAIKFTGFLFLSRIIDKFTINRKIVIQVFNALCGAYALDNREQVRKAVDILTPAVPRRMDDGHTQMLTHLKKLFKEEAHNTLQIQHIIHMIIRNYIVYYSVRLELLPLMLQAIQRCIHVSNGLVEGFNARKIGVETCEMIIKWELLRQKQSEAKDVSTVTDVEVEALLEDLKSFENIDKNVPQDEPMDTGLGKDDSNKAIPKEHVDTVVNLLLKFGCMAVPASSHPHYLSTANELAKKSVHLLRAALKPFVWGQIVTIKLKWIEKQLTIAPEQIMQMRQENAAGNVQQALQQANQTLDVLLRLADVMPRELLLLVFRPIQRPIISCLNSGQTTIIRAVHAIVGRLFEKTRSSAMGLEELDILNQFIAKFLNEQFSNYNKNTAPVMQLLFTAFSMLRAICMHQPGYLDQMCLGPFIKALEKLVRDLLQTSNNNDKDRAKAKSYTEVLAMAMELVRPRIVDISLENRRLICQSVLLPLIEKCLSDKVLETIVRMTHVLVTTHRDENSANPGLPLAVRLHAMMRKRYDGENSSLLTQYLSLALTIFDNKIFRKSEYAEKMEDSFYWGLMSSEPEIRQKFLLVWEQNFEMKTRIQDKIMYILEEQNWAPFRDYYWLRHALWLVLRAVPKHNPEEQDSHKKVLFATTANFWKTFESVSLTKEVVPSLGAINLAGSVPSSRSTPSGNDIEGDSMDVDSETNLDTLLLEQRQLLSEASNFDMHQAMDAVSGLVFNANDTKFVSKMWTRLFLSIWGDMTDMEKKRCADVLEPFLLSGAHNNQGNSPFSVMRTWLDVASKLYPHVQLSSMAIQFLASHHHIWHKGIMLLESGQLNPMMQGAHLPPSSQLQLDVLSHLGMLYKDIQESDQYAAVWDLKAIKPETFAILESVQTGDYSKVLRLCENYATVTSNDLQMDATVTELLDEEFQFVQDEFVLACKELMDWPKIREYSNNVSVQSASLLMQSSVHLGDWETVKEAKDQLSGSIPPKFTNDYTIYNSMLNIMMKHDYNTDPLSLSSKQRMEKALEEAVQVHISYWRFLPPIVTNAHVKVLQAMSLIREVEDCVELKCSLDTNCNSNSLPVEMKGILKACRSRTPAISDEISVISLIYNWRCQIHCLVINRLDEIERMKLKTLATSSQSIVPIHSAAQGQILLARSVRNSRLYDQALDVLNRLHTVPLLPLMDAHHKILEEIKTLRALADHPETLPKERSNILQWATQMIDETDISECQKDQVGKLFTLKGTLLSQLDKREEADKTFCQASQMFDQPIAVFKAWGNHLDRIFHNDKSAFAGMTSGTGAISCFLEAATCEAEPKARKYIARLLWTAKLMVSCGENSERRLDEQLRKQEKATVAYNWLSWIPQLVSEIKHRPHSEFKGILVKIGEQYPLQVFYSLRAYIPQPLVDSVIDEVCSINPDKSPNTESDVPWIQPLLVILRQVTALRSSDIRAYHRLLNEMDTMKQLWAERHFRFARQLKKNIFKCLHQHRGMPLMSITLSQDVIQLMEIWKNDLAAPLEDCIPEESLVYGPDDHKPQVAEKDFIKDMSAEISTVLSTPNDAGIISKLLENVLRVCHRLQKRIKRFPKRIPLEKLNTFMATFNHRRACVEMPSDLLNVLKNSQYVSMIARVNPFIELDFHGGDLVRKISFRAQTGKNCTYYLRRSVGEEHGINRCQQYLSSLNALLAKEKETSKRHLSIYTPTQMRVGRCSSLIETSGVVANSAEAPQTSSPIMHPVEIFSDSLSSLGMKPDDVVAMFYDRTFQMMSDNPDMPVENIRQMAYSELTVDALASAAILARHFMTYYPDPTHFYMVRKQIVRHVAVLSVVEMLTKLTSVSLDDMWINKFTGQYTNPDYNFDLSDEQRMVPFRLTPNLNCFFGLTIGGDFKWSAVAVARCLQMRHPEIMLRPLYWDCVAEHNTGNQTDKFEMANNLIVRIENDTKNLCSMQNSSAGQEIGNLVHISLHPDHLCNVDPSYHPWF